MVLCRLAQRLDSHQATLCLMDLCRSSPHAYLSQLTGLVLCRLAQRLDSRQAMACPSIAETTTGRFISAEACAASDSLVTIPAVPAVHLLCYHTAASSHVLLPSKSKPAAWCSVQIKQDCACLLGLAGQQMPHALRALSHNWALVCTASRSQLQPCWRLATMHLPCCFHNDNEQASLLRHRICGAEARPAAS